MAASRAVEIGWEDFWARNSHPDGSVYSRKKGSRTVLFSTVVGRVSVSGAFSACRCGSTSPEMAGVHSESSPARVAVTADARLPWQCSERRSMKIRWLRKHGHYVTSLVTNSDGPDFGMCKLAKGSFAG